MSEHTPEGDVARLTDKEIELREWLRSQPGGAERWTVVKAGFRRSYDMGMRDSSNTLPDAEKDAAPVHIHLNAEPTHPSIRVMDRDGDVWARYKGRWGCLTFQSTPQVWSDLWHVLGPLTFVDNSVTSPGGSDV